MRPVYQHPEGEKKGVPRAYFPECCPAGGQESARQEGGFKKVKKFITLSRDLKGKTNPKTKERVK